MIRSTWPVALGIVLALLLAQDSAAQQDATPQIRFTNVRIFDGVNDRLVSGDVLVEGKLIKAVGQAVAARDDAIVIDGGGRTLMPGLIDCHTHVMLHVPFPVVTSARDGYLNLVAVKEAEATLMRGITTVRDVGGNSFSVKRAIDDGLFPGPRIYASGPAIGQTSGHSDARSPLSVPAERDARLEPLEQNGHFVVADGVPDVLQRVREALRMGASQIKIMAGGGTATEFDPLDSVQYTPEELRAAVQAAEDWNTYVGVHAYTPEQCQRSIEAGAKVIEHGQMIDEATAIMMKENDVWLNIQPFLPDQEWMLSDTPHMREKQLEMFDGTDTAYRLAVKHGLKVTWGTDIILSPHLSYKQSEMLVLLDRWYTPAEALTIATRNGGQLCKLSGLRDPYPAGELGVIKEGAYADLILVDGNPLEDLALVANPKDNFKLIMKDGVIHKNTTGQQVSLHDDAPTSMQELARELEKADRGVHRFGGR